MYHRIGTQKAMSNIIIEDDVQKCNPKIFSVSVFLKIGITYVKRMTKRAYKITGIFIRKIFSKSIFDHCGVSSSDSGSGKVCSHRSGTSI